MDSVEAVTAAPLARALERGRERFNARFALAQATGGRVDGEAFKQHLREVVAPMADAVERVRPERVDAVVTAAYDLSMDLFAAGLLGPQSRHPAIASGWRSIVPAAPWLLAEEPVALIGSVTNALYNLSAQEGSRPEVWIRDMTPVASAVSDLASLRAAGHVLAWRCGMAQHRLGALASCRTLDPGLGMRLLGMNESDKARFSEVLDRLQTDPWLLPQNVFDSPATLRVVSIVGAFRGFGGHFQNPPNVFASGGSIIAADRENHWAVIADLWGSALLPLSISPQKDAATKQFRLSRDGEVTFGDSRAKFPGLANATSFATDGRTLAVTIDQSHQIFLIALQ
jgi:hypothetical protein